jgi:hypothetical protein
LFSKTASRRLPQQRLAGELWRWPEQGDVGTMVPSSDGTTNFRAMWNFAGPKRTFMLHCVFGFLKRDRVSNAPYRPQPAHFENIPIG